MTDAEVICEFMENRPLLPMAWPGRGWLSSLRWWQLAPINGGGMAWIPEPLTLDRLREVEARLTEEQWEAYGNALVTLLLDEHGKYKDTQLIHLSPDQKIKALASVLREVTNG